MGGICLIMACLVLAYCCKVHEGFRHLDDTDHYNKHVELVESALMFPRCLVV